MRVIKRLYGFILKSFLPLFAMTFFIVVFIILMQFLWKNIDELVGKGLTVSLLGELFFYAALTMVPTALPLAILLASLMTFGNLGEKFELTAMKASGVSLIKSMRPLIVFVGAIAVGAYFFSDIVIPKAQVKMYTLLWSMRMKSPELEIPEGVFYTQIPGYNLYVQHKDRDTGMLYDMMIYDVSHGGDNSTILVADSGRLAFTGDMRYLYLHLFKGEQFENLREQKSMDRNVPFRREAFKEKELLIPFDANFNRLDEEGMRNLYVGKNASQLRQGIDSIGSRLDSTGTVYAGELRATSLPLLGEARYRDLGSVADYNAGPAPLVSDSSLTAAVAVRMDTLIGSLTRDRRERVYDRALAISQRDVSDYQFKSLTVSDDKRTLRRHEIELYRKYTLSVACLVFFFIGAPLGAIIRKGGIGLPMVISVLLFLVYYIIDNTGYKMARDGHWAVWFGIWLSTFVLAPLGIYVTYKAMNDSAVFDGDRIKMFIARLFHTKEARKVRYKEVIIDELSVDEARSVLQGLRESASGLLAQCGPQGYVQYFDKGYDIGAVREFGNLLEESVETLTNLRNQLAVNKLVDYPVVMPSWLYAPGRVRWLGQGLKWFVPAGAIVYLLGRRSQRNLRAELQQTVALTGVVEGLLDQA